MKVIKFILPVIALLVLITGIGLQVFAEWVSPEPEPVEPFLSEAIPQSLPGWEVKDLNLGPTESVTEQSFRILNLDDFVYREYRRGATTFTVYVAYWGPGKMPIRLVNQHTPDRCWTENGWACTDRRFHVRKSVRDRALHPAQWGVYTINDFSSESYFWHIVDDEPHWFGGERINSRTSLTSVLLDFRNIATNRNPDQFFVRIVSQESLDAIWEEPGFAAVMDDLADLCLAAETRAAGDAG
ncbi:MAG: exosortase-associated EpsI family protein [Oceanipulchritudo sp.]